MAKRLAEVDPQIAPLLQEAKVAVEAALNLTERAVGPLEALLKATKGGFERCELIRSIAFQLEDLLDDIEARAKSA